MTHAPYTQAPDSQSAELKRLRWQCRRGMKEMDALLVHWLEHRYLASGVDQQAVFKALLQSEDDQLWRWLAGRERAEPAVQALIDAIVAAAHA